MRVGDITGAIEAFAPLAIQEAGPIDRRTDSILRTLSAGQDASEAIRELAAIRPDAPAPSSSGRAGIHV